MRTTEPPSDAGVDDFHEIDSFDVVLKVTEIVAQGSRTPSPTPVSILRIGWLGVSAAITATTAAAPTTTPSASVAVTPLSVALGGIGSAFLLRVVTTATRLPRLCRRAALLTRFLEQGLARQSDTAGVVDVDAFDEELLAFFELVAHVANVVVGDLGNVKESVRSRQDLDEGPEIGDPLTVPR